MTVKTLPITLAISVLVASGANAETVIMVQDNAYPPYMYEENGEPVGIYRNVLEEAFARMDGDYELDLQALPWARAVGLVASGDAHALVGTYHRPEARPFISHYSTSPFSENVSVFCRAGIAQSDWEYPQDFAGLVFGNNSGFATPGPEFFSMVEGGLISLQEAPNTEQNIRKLAAGRIDCYVQEQLTMQASLNALNVDGVERILDTSSEPGHMGFTEHWQGTEADNFQSEFDAILQEMLDDGTIDRIIQQATGS